MRPELSEAAKQAISDSSPPPANEADTCNRIIYPLLLAAGYSRKEIKSQDRDAAKQIPDYTLLPDMPDHTWFLEAKAWRVGLDDSHAAQAVSYPNTQGKRWVVLTNGKEWRLYDNQIQETAEKKLAASALLRDESFVSFLDAISRQSITEGKLEEFVLNQRLYTALAVQLVKQDSDVIKAIRKVLRTMPGLGQVSGAKIAGYFQGEKPATPSADDRAESFAGTPASASNVLPSSAVCVSEIKKGDVTGEKPASLTLPGGDVIQGEQWREITTGLAKYLCERGLMSGLPLFVGPKAKRPCLAMKGDHGTVNMRQPVEFFVGRESYLIETHYSAIGHVRNWSLFLATAGLSDADCYLRLSD